MSEKERVVNGRVYTFWNQFVDQSEQWKGGVLEDHDIPPFLSTIIDHIELVPNGKESAFFQVVGVAFTCGFDVKYGGVVGGEDGWITFSGYAGHTWRIQKPA